MTLPIQQAAVTTVFFERAHVYRSNAECRFGEAMSSELGATAPHKPEPVTKTVRGYVLADVVLDADWALLMRGGVIIDDSRYFTPTGHEPTVTPDRLHHQPADTDFVIGYNRTYRDYQHWVTQCLPAIDWGLRQTRQHSVRLVLPPLAQWQEEMLRAMGYQDVPRLTVQPKHFYHLPHAEYAEFLNGKTSFGVSRSTYATARRLLEGIPDQGGVAPILYVPCSNPHYGQLINEAEVASFLERRGVVIVRKDMPLKTRLNLFRHADVVIGPLGEGLTDILFCRPGTLLWEWMPRHHHNASINRLAQAAQADYWGDMFDSAPPGNPSGAWMVDLEVVRSRLTEISTRIAHRSVAKTAVSPAMTATLSAVPVDDLMVAFESLGDSCEFGLVQRAAGAEPLGLLRFAGTHLERLVGALDNKFAGVGDLENVRVYPAGEVPRRELMVHEQSLDTRYHTFIREGEVDPDDLRRRQARQLSFLRRKMLGDLETGEKIWVWRQGNLIDAERLEPLLERLRRHGPNRLLWVTPADRDHNPGTIERLAPDFVRGYVKHLAPYQNAGGFDAASWFAVCEATYSLFYPDAVPAPALMHEVAQQTSGAAEAPSAMDFLRQGAHLPTDPPTSQPIMPVARLGLFGRLWASLFRR